MIYNFPLKTQVQVVQVVPLFKLQLDQPLLQLLQQIPPQIVLQHKSTFQIHLLEVLHMIGILEMDKLIMVRTLPLKFIQLVHMMFH
mgnify:CR=1 FL=1